MEIPNIKLNNGKEIPQLGLGTWDIKGSSGIDSLKKALSLGYRHIDTAEMYGNESEVGEAIKESGIPRGDIFITSKVWPDNLSYDKFMNSLNSSLEKLDTDYIDLYLIHWPREEIDFEEIVKAFKDAYDSGKILSAGISNFSVEDIKKIMEFSKKFDLPVTMNQIEINPSVYPKDIIEFCKENKIAITAYSPLDKGNVKTLEVLKKIGSGYEKTASQVGLRWLVQKGFVVIPKASSEKHLVENMEIFDFDLDEEDIEMIENSNNL